MAVADSLHRTLRGLAAAALRDALTAAGCKVGPNGVREMDTPNVNLLDKPGVAVCEGTPTPTGGGTNQRDAVLLPLFVGLYQLPADKLTGSHAGVEPGRFLEIVRETFHNRRLAGAPNNVLLGDVAVMGPPYDESEMFAGLKTAAVVTFQAWVSRGT